MPALQLRLRTTCTTCGHPIPLTSAHVPVACPTCDAASPMDHREFYWVASEGVSARSESEGAGLLGDAQPSDVTCAVCAAVVTEEAIEQGFVRGALPCGCGNVIQVRAVPHGIDRHGWWSALVGETSHAKHAPSAAPVQFQCTSCGGALSVDGTTRTPPCTFCNTRVYLPDDLWRALRPTPKAEPFYLWVRGESSDRWEAQSRRALRVPLAVAGMGTALAAAGGIATGVSGAFPGVSGADVFFMVFIASILLAGVLRALLAPKRRKA